MDLETGRGLRSGAYVAPRIANMDGLRKALSACTDLELLGLVDATDAATQLAPELVAWIEAALLWEWNRRTGFTYELLPPSDMTDEERHAFAKAATAMQRAFGRSFPAVRALIVELEKVLSREARNQ